MTPRAFLIILALSLLSLRASALRPGDVLAQFDLPGSSPMGATFDGEALWVADRKENKVFRLDPRTGEVLASLPTPGYRPTGITWDGKHLWVADRDKNEIFRMRPDTGLVDRVHKVSVQAPRGLAWDGECIYLADGRNDEILCLDPMDGTVIRHLQAPFKAITGLAFDGKYLWAADRNSDEIYMMDPERGYVVAMMKSPGPNPWGLAWGKDRLWNVDFQTRKLYAINVKADDPLMHLEDKNLHVEYDIHFMSQGPDPVKEVDFYIAVPEKRYNQTLLSEPLFSPEPFQILKDRWGQRVAHFRRTDVAPGVYMKPRMAVDVTLHRTRFWIVPDKVRPYRTISASLRDKYLANGRKFRLNSPVVQAAAKMAVGDETQPYWMARKIYQFVLNKLDYKLSGGWDTAPLLLERGTGSCSEYAFVMIALCRAAGIPARYVGGVVTRGDDAFVDNVFHRWAEIYLPGYGWIPVDPDRGKRKTPRGQALGFGNLENTLLVTTVSGGESEYLDWRYNGNVKWTFQGHSSVYIEHIGELSPLATVRSPEGPPPPPALLPQAAPELPGAVVPPAEVNQPLPDN